MAEEETPETEETPEQETPETEEKEEESDPTPEELKTQIEKAKRAAARRDGQLRKAQEELAKLKEEKEGPKQEDPLVKANARLIHASARTVLAASGIADKEDQKAALAFLNLSDIEVDDEDGPDEDAIEERVSEAFRIFGGVKKAAPGSRRPGSVKAKDQSKGDTVTDPDAARYRRIMGIT